MLIVVRVCGHSIWRKNAYMPLWPDTLIVPADEIVRLKTPCDNVEVEVHFQGTIRAKFELAGMATLEGE